MAGGFSLEDARAANPGGLTWKYDDGGREAAGFRGKTRDCVTRAVAIALELDYRTVYAALATANREYHSAKALKAKSPRMKAMHERAAKTTAREGIADDVTDEFVARHGWTRVTMPKGSRLSDLPTDRVVIARLKNHLAAVQFGVIRDTFDSGYGYNRPCFGYWTRSEQ